MPIEQMSFAMPKRKLSEVEVKNLTKGFRKKGVRAGEQGRHKRVRPANDPGRCGPARKAPEKVTG